ncbi:DNA repair protein RadA [Trichothermofontia sichuanensis B231]|uniref:DNA repair protein RadA n=1 Tax=Trichothermofontia sichuanensis TaxID=3045816 RepID=UPI002245E40C|nr:DNA repair protein RadA [Trichothermofontia sichuanensis]UZQ55243.1 DNA repair protein RadA [Trichothermofontia sichuanensis B231]
MPKSRTQYVCIECGAESLQYFGRCPDCKAWGSLQEQIIDSAPPGASARDRIRTQPKGRAATAQAIAAVPLEQIRGYPQSRLSTGYAELDRVLGGGIVPGSLILLGGDPGIGKSTLLLQVAGTLAQQFPVLYVCAEESGQQVKLRWQRLAIGNPNLNTPPNPTIGRGGLPPEPDGPAQVSLNPPSAPPAIAQPHHGPKHPHTSTHLPAQLYILPEVNLDTILVELESLQPKVAIIDSIQALYFPALNSAPGSVAQVRECTSALMQLAKRDHIALFIVGHVTKEGAIAGPKVLEHLVDTVLYFEGDRFASHRLLRSVKNRFGATQELGVFEMVDRGLTEVANPSELFLGNREELTSGTATIVACEGTRPLVVELQALVSPTSYSSPRRSTTGIEFNRLLQILAVLEKRVGIPLSKLDAYVASSGGLNVAEPAADLGVAIAVAASFRDRMVDPNTVIIGEVGLGGQVRPVSQLEMRLKEAAKLGFKRAIVPKGQVPTGLAMEIIPVSRVLDAIATALIPSPTSST